MSSIYNTLAVLTAYYIIKFSVSKFILYLNIYLELVLFIIYPFSLSLTIIYLLNKDLMP